MSLEIQFPTVRPKWVFERDCVLFPIIVNGDLIRCLITAEALIQDYGAGSPNEDDCIRAFTIHRAKIDEAVRQTIERRKVGDRSEVLLKAARSPSEGSLVDLRLAPEIQSRPDLASLIRAVDYRQRMWNPQDNAKLQVTWELAGRDPDILQVDVEEKSSGISMTDWFSKSQLEDPAYLRHRFDDLWSGHYRASFDKKLERLRTELEAV